MNKTEKIIKDAMKAVSKDVRLPKCVRDGIVKEKGKNNLEEQFLPYQEAIAMKELEFNEVCIVAYFNQTKKIELEWYPEGIVESCEEYYYCTNNSKLLCSCTSPTYQQAFDWFEKEHNIIVDIRPNYSFNERSFQPYFHEDGKETYLSGLLGGYVSFNTKQKARVASVRKLISMVKDRKK